MPLRPFTFTIRILLTMALLPPARAVAQSTTAGDPAYLHTVYERCPGADILKVQRAEFDLLEVEYLCNGRPTELAFRDGKVVYEEREAQLDAAVIDRITRTLEKKYPGWLLDEIAQVAATDTVFLKAEVVLDGVEQNVFFTTAGRKFTPEALLASGRWTIKELRSMVLPRTGYDLLAPDSMYALPDLLREVSGITIGGPTTVLCVQDELGVVFEHDLAGGAITAVHRFTDVGDFEDLEVQGEVITVLRSDGKLYRIDRRTGALLGEQLHPLPSLNYEGLCSAGDALYLVGKEAPVAGMANARLVHSLRGDGAPELARTLDADEVARLFSATYPALAHHAVKFHPSAAAVHPITGELYVLSATDRLLAIYGDDLRAVVPLPAERCYKPEGLAFHPNGDLLISNEGDKKGLTPGNVLRFGYRDR